MSGEIRMTIDDARNLISAIIENAVAEYRALESHNYVKAGVLIAKPGPLPRKISGYSDAGEICELLHFLGPGGRMDEILALWRFEVSGDVIRRGIGIKGVA